MAEAYPRATNTSDNRVDLAVSDVILTTDGTAPPLATPSHRLSKLVREGKGGTAGDSLNSIKGQLQRFLLASDVGHTTPY